LINFPLTTVELVRRTLLQLKLFHVVPIFFPPDAPRIALRTPAEVRPASSLSLFRTMQKLDNELKSVR
jgi:hypothetical protein